MRMELIQPFINAADAVFAESLQAPTKIQDLSMDDDTYRRKGVAALIAIKGDIEGRVILDLSPEVAVKVASHLAGVEVKASEQVVKETVCELAKHGHRQFRNAAERPGVPLQGVSARNSYGRNGAGRQRGYGSAGDLHRDAVRQHLPEHRDALSASASAGAETRFRRWIEVTR